MPRKSLLQNLEIIQILILHPRIKLDSAHRQIAIDGIDDLAIHAASAALFEFGDDCRGEEVVEPGKQLASCCMGKVWGGRRGGTLARPPR